MLTRVWTLPHSVGTGDDDANDATDDPTADAIDARLDAATIVCGGDNETRDTRRERNMDKKVLVGIVEGMVAQVVAKHNIEESEARTLVGGLLRRLTDQIVAKIEPPTLTLS